MITATSLPVGSERICSDMWQGAWVETLVQCDCCQEHVFWRRDGGPHICALCDTRDGILIPSAVARWLETLPKDVSGRVLEALEKR